MSDRIDETDLTSAEKALAARVSEALARAGGAVQEAERYVQGCGMDSRRFRLRRRPDPGAEKRSNLGHYQRLTNAKGWPKLRL